MDLKTIFNKTPKASRAPLPWVGGLSAQFKQILSYIDGKQNVEEILHKAGKLSINELHKILIKLEEDGYIKRVSSHQAEPDWLNDIGSFGINANNNYSIAVEELDAAELDFDASDFSVNTAADTNETSEQQQKPEATVDADVERRAQEVKAIKAKREAERKAQAEAAEIARIEAAEQAKRIAEAAAKARQEVERIEREKAEALARTEAEAAARIQAELEIKAKAEAEEQARIEKERKAQEEAAEKARLEAERIAREEAEEQARIERERKAQEELAAKAKQEAEEKARLEAERIEREKAEAIAREKAAEEARLQAEAERKAQVEAEEKARLEAERIAREEAEAAARLEAERIEREKAEEQARIAAELKAQEEAAEKARLEAERIAREEAEEQARIELERKAQEELAAKAKLEAEEQARLESERIAREKAEAIAKAIAEEEARLQAEAERQAKAEAEEQARVEAELKAQAEAAEQARLGQERIAREAAEEEARVERERIAQEELAAKVKLEAEEQARLEADRIAREKAEAIAMAIAEEEARLRAEAERQAKAEAEEKARLEAERMAQVAAAEQKLREAERAAREELKAQQEAEKKAQAEAEKAARAEAKLLAKEQKAAKAKLKAEEKARAKLLRGPVMTNLLASRLVKPVLISIPLVLILAVVLMHIINLTMLIEPIEKLATASIGEPVKVQQVHASLFPQPHLTLTDVTVGSSGDVKIGSVNMVSVASMMFKEVKIFKSIDISNVTLSPAEFGRQAQWVNNAAKAGRVKIEKMTLKQISFKVSDLEPEVFNGKVALTPSGQLSNVELVNAGGNLTLLLTPQNGSAALTLTASGWQPALFKRLAFDEVTATGVISQNQVNFSQIEAKAFGGVIKAQGELNWAGGLRASGNFELIKMTLPRVLAAYESDASITGTLNATGVFTSSANQASELEEAAQVDANFEVLTGKINEVALTHALVAGPASKPSPDADFTRFDSLTGNLQFSDGQYKYRQFALKTGQFRARGNFNIEPDKAVSGRVSAELTSATQRRQGNFTVSGEVADIKLK